MSRILDERDKQELRGNISTATAVLNEEIELLEAETNQKITDLDNKTTRNLNSHTSNTSNPHKVTYVQVGADPTGSAQQALKDAKAYTDTEIANLVGGAPEVLDTLDELAAALADDENFAVTMTTELSKKTNNTDFTAHTSDVGNPHKVTASQVGLGNVPNVSTNDQTPTYIEAATLATLTSGEKLSVSMGKIMKAITDFISHLANKENPHSVTKAQVGLGNADNTSDIDKPVSTAQEAAINGVQTNLNTHANDKNNPHAVTKAQVGLGNADNTSDALKPVSTAQATAIAEAKAEANSYTDDKIAALGTIATKSVVEKSDLAADIQASLGLADTGLQSYTETDPTVPEWAKQPSKPTYTASEVGALSDTTLPVISEEDEGKVLCVVNGAFALVPISDLLPENTETPDTPEDPVEPEA